MNLKIVTIRLILTTLFTIKKRKGRSLTVAKAKDNLLVSPIIIMLYLAVVCVNPESKCLIESFQQVGHFDFFHTFSDHHSLTPLMEWKSFVFYMGPQQVWFWLRASCTRFL